MNKIGTLGFTTPTGVGAQFSAGDYQNAYKNETLTTMLKSYQNDETKFIWSKIFPVISVKKEKGDIYNIGKQSMRLVETKVAQRGSAHRIEFGVKLDTTWTLEQYALYTDVYKSDVENADSPLDAQRDKTKILSGIAGLRKEYSAYQIFNSSLVTKNAGLTGTAKFSDASSDPYVTIEYYISQVKANCGSRANYMVITYDVMSNLINHPKVIERYKYSRPVGVNEMMKLLSETFGIEVLIADTQKWNADGTDIDDGTLSFLASGKIFLGYREQQGLYSKGFGFTYTRGAGQQVLVADYPVTDQLKERKNSLVIATDEYDMVVQDVNCGFLIYDVL